MHGKRYFAVIFYLMRFLFVVLTLVLFAPHTSSAAGLIACGGAGEPACQSCHVIQLANDGLSFIITLSLVIAGGLFVYAGYLMTASRGDEGMISKGKAVFTNVGIGFIIVIAAWLMIDTIMKGLLPDGSVNGFGPWNEISCVAQPAVNPATVGSVATSSVDVAPDHNFTYQPGIERQIGDASGELNALLNCISARVPGNVGEISSISDSLIVNGKRTFNSCAGGGCAHSAGSCHYGGKSCVGKSYAVDFGDEKNAGTLMPAARACGANYVVNEGSHVHASVGAKCGCK